MIGDFHVQLKVSFEFFTRDFHEKKIKWKKFLKEFLWKNPRASLARAAFISDFLIKGNFIEKELSLIPAIDL